MECYFAEGSTNQSTPVIYQQNPINMISQNGPNGHISIMNSKAIQIGHRNVMVGQMASGENGESSEMSRRRDLSGHLLHLGGGREWGAFNLPGRKGSFQISKVLPGFLRNKDVPACAWIKPLLLPLPADIFCLIFIGTQYFPTRNNSVRSSSLGCHKGSLSILCVPRHSFFPCVHISETGMHRMGVSELW